MNLTSLALFYFHKIYFYPFWPNLDPVFAYCRETEPFCGREL